MRTATVLFILIPSGWTVLREREVGNKRTDRKITGQQGTVLGITVALA